MDQVAKVATVAAAHQDDRNQAHPCLWIQGRKG